MAELAPAGPALPPPHERVYGAANAFMQTQALTTAARLGLADALAREPLSIAELALAVRAKEGHLRRVLRLLLLLGIFREVTPGVYANNEASQLLRSGEPGSMLDIVLHLGDESYRAHAKMSDSLLAGHPDVAFREAHGGLAYWEWLEQAENQEASERFDRAMDNYTQAALPVILREYDWSQHGNATVEDVGGGVGGVLAALLAQHPGMRGILFERPPVIQEAERLWEQGHPDLSGRVQLVGGDFFEAVPPADVYFMKHILHDWSNQESIKILRTLRAGAGPDARLLLCEAVMPDGKPWPMDKAYLDLQMMVMAGGQERTAGEWRSLLREGGFEMQEVKRLSNGSSIITARPAAHD